MALSADEKKLLAELQARINEPDEDDDFEIEVYDSNAGKGARIPYRKGKSWLFDVLGIGDAPASAGEDEAAPGGEVAPGSGGADKKTPGKSYFGRQG